MTKDLQPFHHHSSPLSILPRLLFIFHFYPFKTLSSLPTVRKKGVK